MPRRFQGKAGAAGGSTKHRLVTDKKLRGEGGGEGLKKAPPPPQALFAPKQGCKVPQAPKQLAFLICLTTRKEMS